MQQDQSSTTHQGSCMAWEVNRQGKQGRKAGPLSWTEAWILQLSLPTMTGW
jgi:hypothetical protein